MRTVTLQASAKIAVTFCCVLKHETRLAFAADPSAGIQ